MGIELSCQALAAFQITRSSTCDNERTGRGARKMMEIVVVAGLCELTVEPADSSGEFPAYIRIHPEERRGRFGENFGETFEESSEKVTEMMSEEVSVKMSEKTSDHVSGFSDCPKTVKSTTQ